MSEVSLVFEKICELESMVADCVVVVESAVDAVV